VDTLVVRRSRSTHMLALLVAQALAFTDVIPQHKLDVALAEASIKGKSLEQLSKDGVNKPPKLQRPVSAKVWVDGECQDTVGDTGFSYNGDSTCSGASYWCGNEYFDSLCPVTCGTCVCQDDPTYSYCTSSSVDYFCTAYDWFPAECPLSCGVCTPGTTTPVKASPPPSPPPPSPSTDGGNPTTGGGDSVDYIVSHNEYRAKHVDTPDVEYDATLAAQAQSYADTCPTGHASDSNGAGENLYWAASTKTPTLVGVYEKAVQAWYDEIKDYSWPQTPSDPVNNGGVTGHFTQVVWKSSVKVGCGAVTGCTNMFGGSFINNAVVCRYSPPGNWQGEYYLEVGDLK